MNMLIFVSYSPQDKRLWEALKTTLALHRANNKARLWDPHIDIEAGQTVQEEIEAHIRQARIFLLLLSPDFFADEDCLNQMQAAFVLQKQSKEPVYVVPILLRPCLWKRDGLEDLQILPRKEIPVTKWSDRDEVLVDIAQEVHTVIGYIDKGEFVNTARSTPPPAAPVQPTSKYSVWGNAVHVGMMGDNRGTVTINQGGPLSRSRPSSAPVPQGEDVDIAIIIALRDEFKVLFSEIGSGVQTVRDPQTNGIYYRFERSSSLRERPYRCVATLVGGMGPTRAALHAEKTIMRWNPTTLILPGIAASLSSDARLGDVVVADQVDGYMENAKAHPTQDGQGYELALSGEVYRTSGTLLGEIQNFEFSAPMIFAAWEQGTQSTLEKLIERSQRAELISKQLLREQARILDGHIASGPVVGAAQAFSTWLKGRDRKYLALEMEAMGLMAAVYNRTTTRNTLILRGISDYGDVQKSMLDAIGEGVLRHYAMLNTLRLLWSLLDAGLLPQSPA